MELIRRQGSQIRIPSEDETATIDIVDDLIHPDADAAGGPSRLAKAAKITGLGVGALVLCGSVFVASTLARGHRPTANAAIAPETVLTGAEALRPDAVAAQLAGRHGAASAPRSTSAPDADTDRPANGRTATGTIAGPAPQPPAPPAGTPAAPAAGRMSAADVVRDFFREATVTPSLAAALIDPSLLAADPIGFARSWGATPQLRIESIQTNPDGSVQAVVRMLNADGTWMRVVELMHVTVGDTPLITGAELLSAQHG